MIEEFSPRMKMYIDKLGHTLLWKLSKRTSNKEANLKNLHILDNLTKENYVLVAEHKKN